MVVACLKVYFRHSPGGTEENIEKFQSKRWFPKFRLEALQLERAGCFLNYLNTVLYLMRTSKFGRRFAYVCSILMYSTMKYAAGEVLLSFTLPSLTPCRLSVFQ